MKRINLIVLTAVLLAFLSGCSTFVQKPVSFSPSSIQSGKVVIGVVQTKLPEFSVAFPGADCLLCIGLAMATHGKLRDHSKTLNTNDIQPLQDDLVKKLVAKGYSVKKIDQNIDFSKLKKNSDEKEGFSNYDFSNYAKEGINMLLVINLKEIGFKRGYQNYIPTEPMKAQVVAEGFLVNTSDGKYTWYQDYKLSKGVTGEWDVEPKFPQLTNAYYSLIEEFKDSFIGSFN